MAETIMFNVVREIIKKLSSEAVKELGMMWGIKDDITKLTNSASIIKAVLIDAENKQDQSKALSEWLGKLKHVFYDVEDVIDEFSSEALQRELMTKDKRAKQVRIFFSRNNQLLFANKMAHKIKNVREILDAIAADRNNFGLTINVVEPNIPHVPGRDTHSHVREEEVIGRNDDKEKVKKDLLNINVNQNISFIVIAGMGGLGKTTLAKYLYNDEKVSKFFDLKIWVCVSELFDVEVIVKNIIESISTVRPDTCKMESLQRQLKELIEGKKYLLVLDDIWNETEEKWSELKDLFMFGARGSKILITKRDNKPVSEIADMTLLYDLEGLSEEYSWSLFKKVAFKEGEEPNNPNLIKLGKEIVQKCKGFPLLIRSIGRSLHSETSEEKWMSIKDKLRPANNVMSNLKLSYDHLPTSYLKQCFVYCSLFPKDYSITSDELIRLSIALGFVPSSDSSKSTEDLGNDYFMELCWRSLLQSSILESEDDFYYDSFRITSSYQNFRFTYKMHDLMHDLAQMVASDECKSLNNEVCDGVNEKTRHISLQSELNLGRNLPTSIFKAKGLRTLLLQNDEFRPITIDTSTLNKLFSSCVRLRVLTLNRSAIKKVPKSIKKLRQLRYLDLSRNKKLKFLPNSITELQNLQTLNLHGCSLEELPRDIKNLVNLRHLDLNGTRLKHMPKGMGKLTSLQTLNLFVLGDKDDLHVCKLSELKELNHLKGGLVIKGLKQLNTTPSESSSVRLKDKKYLRNLILRWDLDWERQDDEVGDEMVMEGLEPHPNIEYLSILCYMGERLSNWVALLSKLIKIQIGGCRRLQHLPQFDHLPLLKCLSLIDLHALEFIDIKDSFSSSMFFPSLQYLCLREMHNLKGWWKWEPCSLPSFPPLRKIVISDCPKLVSMPLHFDVISVKLGYMSLKTLKFPNQLSPSALENLALTGIEDLEYLPNRLWRHLNNLESLQIVDCQNFKGCVYENVEIKESEVKDGKLKDLSLRSLPKLVSLPIGPQHSATLQTLKIYDCCNLRHLPEWIGSLVSLSKLQIIKCPNLESLQIVRCQNLKNVEIEAGKKLESLGEVKDRKLKDLELIKLAKLVSLPIGPQHSATLQKLWISECCNLRDLPEWIGSLVSLSWLQINKCPNLKSFPEGMCQLQSLQTLVISECPELEERCKEGGQDWPKIAHVPEVSLSQ